jgi:hypothetical protein
MVIQWYRTVEYGMVWYVWYQLYWYDSGCTARRPHYVELYNMSSVYRSSNCELYNMSSVYRISNSELFDMSSVYRSPNCELYNMSSLYPGSRIMSSLIWALCITDHETWALWYELSLYHGSRITNFESWALWCYYRLAVCHGLRVMSTVIWSLCHELGGTYVS